MKTFYCSDIQILDETIRPWTYQFRHVGEAWQRETASRLGLPIEKIVCVGEAAVPLGSPKAVEKIKGDGNCFFRCFSYLITGKQNYHGDIRKIVCDALPVYAPDFPEGSDARHIKNMRNNATFATEVELQAVARLLGVPIFTWSRFTAPLGSPEQPWR